MFIILNTSFLAHTRFFPLILTITIWHVVALVWHLWNRELEHEVRIHVRVHIISIISYATISIVFLDCTTITCTTLWNKHQLYYYYCCDRVHDSL